MEKKTGVRAPREAPLLTSLLLVAGIILLLFSLVFPYWKIHVIAPQYPKGLNISIFVNHLEGDVQEIDMLNHYIGMKMLGKAAQIERSVAIAGISTITLSLLVALFLRRRWSILFILPAIFFPSIFALDLFLWLRDYGLHLDPHAPLSSSIKPFVPTLFGKGIIGQFKSISSFEIGFYFSVLAALLASVASILRFGGGKKIAHQIIPLAIGLSVLFGSSSAIAKTIDVMTECPVMDIQHALAIAEPGDTIRVHGGRVYHGPWVIDKSVKLVGENFPVIDGGGKGTVVDLRAPNIEMRGFEIRGSGNSLVGEDTGIVAEAPGILLEDNRLDDVLFGISLKRAPKSTLRGNTLHGKSLPEARRGDLIRVWYSDDVVLDGNHTTEGRDAVIWFSKHVLLENNIFEGGRYGLHYMYCDDSTVKNNMFTGNSVGVYMMYSERIQILGNRILNNRGPSGFGIGLKDMSNAKVENNIIANNRVGMFFDGATGDYQRNLIAFNDIGITLLSSSQRNHFKENSFVENAEQVIIEGMGSTMLNDWNGNFWSDYRGVDANQDGAGDRPYQSRKLFERLVDRYPVLKLFSASPSTQAIDFASSTFPVFAPQSRFQDAAPLTNPVLPEVRVETGKRSWPFVMISGMLFLPILGLTIRNRSDLKHGLPMPSTSTSSTLESNIAIQVSELTKNFGKVHALKQVSFQVKQGETLVLWGPNGAGKTTVLRSLLGIIPFEGQLNVWGLDVRSAGKAVRREIGYVPQEIRFYNDQTVWETICFFGRLRRVSKERAKQLLKEWDLEASVQKKVNALSGGMKQRLALVVSLLSDPPIIFLDEATSHLDVQSRREFIALLERLKKMGKTLMLCSHRSSEVWKLADRVLVLDQGLKVIEGSPEEVVLHLGKGASNWSAGGPIERGD
ncbi:MAG: nitrous oxide reductase family maturation protein NosD [Candidatus Omnitrophica bacterium]|nr:nitrous oxide reductase family maturation protein NosD [Candidatus Omnitrophota bacterium]